MGRAGHFPGCETAGCEATRCREARAMRAFCDDVYRRRMQAARDAEGVPALVTHADLRGRGD